MSTHPLVLSSTFPRKGLLACPPSLPSIIVESTLSFSSSPSDLAKVRLLPTLALFHFMIWTDGSFPFGKCDLAYLPTAFPGALRPFPSFWQDRYTQVFPLKSAPFCKLSAGLGSTNKSAISLLSSFYLTHATLFLTPSFLLPQILWQICLLFSLVLSGYNGSSDTHSTRGTTRLMRWSGGSATRALCNPL